MPLIYRHQKGAPLTSEEVDGNFQELMTRIENLEKTPALAESIQKIEQKGDYVEVIGTAGTIFGSYKIPLLMYRLRGYWRAQTSYVVADVIARPGQAWVCYQSHVSKEQFDPKEWRLLLEVPSSEALTIYSPSTLPDSIAGTIALYKTQDQTSLVYGTEEGWHEVQDHPLESRKDA